MIPGRLLYRLASALCSADMRERVIDAFFADFQHEWLDAVTLRERVAVMARGYGWFCVTLAGCLVHDVQHDCAGFRARILNRIVYLSAMVSATLIAIAAPSWVKTGQADWSNAARGLLWVGSFTAAILLAAYRSRNANRRAWPAFCVAMGVSVAILISHPINRHADSVDWYKWLYQVSLTMSWPFLVRKPSQHGPAEAGPYR